MLYTGGVFTRGDETQIHVLYGKVKNVPAGGRTPSTAEDAE